MNAPHLWNDLLASEDVQDMYDTFTATLKNISNSTCPVTVTKQKLVRKMPDKPWMPQKRSVASEERYQKYKNKLTGILRYCEKKNFTELLEKKRKHDRNLENYKLPD